MRISDWSSDVCSSDLIKKYAKAHGLNENDARLPSIQLPEFESVDAILGLVEGHLKRQIKMEVLRAIGSIKSQEENLHTISKYARSEERRVGKEGVSTGRSRWSQDQ